MAFWVKNIKDYTTWGRIKKALNKVDKKFVENLNDGADEKTGVRGK